LFDRSYATVLAVNQLVEIGGKRRDRRLSAQSGYRSARALFLDAKRTLEQGVAAAFIGAVQAGENERILRESAGSLQREAEIGRTRLRAGDISESDKNQIELNARQFELQAESAAAQAKVARVAVEVLMGLKEPTGEWSPSEDLGALAEKAPPPSAVAAALGRPDVVAAEESYKKSEYDVKLQKAIRIPDPTVMLEYQRYPNPPYGADSVGIGLSFPLPLWNRNRGAIQAAEGAREQARLAMEKARAQAASDMATARITYESATRRWERYRDEMLKKSRDVVEAIRFAYTKGGASLLDLLVAERNDNDLRIAAAQAQTDRAVAAANLKAAGQTLSESDLKTK
jgi:cobalt-zinc-cadmium efflux system outer membrane protein